MCSSANSPVLVPRVDPKAIMLGHLSGRIRRTAMFGEVPRSEERYSGRLNGRDRRSMQSTVTVDNVRCRADPGR